jgi:hypothetical protein
MKILDPSRARISRKYQPARPINAEGQKDNGSKEVEEIKPHIMANK